MTALLAVLDQVWMSHPGATHRVEYTSMRRVVTIQCAGEHCDWRTTRTIALERLTIDDILLERMVNAEYIKHRTMALGREPLWRATVARAQMNGTRMTAELVRKVLD